MLEVQGAPRVLLRVPLQAMEEDVYRAARLAHAHNFISALPDGYDTLVGAGQPKLSGGQAQRVALARALLTDTGAPPKVLILDEATSALDAESEAAISKALAEIKRDRTVLIIAHRLKTISEADQILVMHRGRVVERGVSSTSRTAHEELLRRRAPIYSEMVRLSRSE